MKRFLLFAFDTFYPGGGWNDFVGGYDTFAEARQRAGSLKSDCWHIVDAESGEIEESVPYWK